MAPVQRTDVDSERFSSEEWKSYELWEKVENRERRKRTYWIAGASVLFLLLAAVPVVREYTPKWKTLAASRRLAIELSRVKRDVTLLHSPLKLRFTDTVRMVYVVEQVPSCGSTAGMPEGVILREGKLGKEISETVLLPPSEGLKFGLENLVDEYCYEPVTGWKGVDKGDQGLAIFPVNDLAEGESSRASVVLLSGVGGEVSFH